MKLGIVHQRIQPSSPQENGAHERMHKTLKASDAPAGSESSRTAVEVRQLPARVQLRTSTRSARRRASSVAVGSVSSPISRPHRLPEYPGHFEVRRVSNAGEFKLGAQHRFLSQALKGDHIGLEPVDDGLWNIVYYKTLLGRLSERTGKISGASFRSEKC
jgi:putative transposase